MESMWGMRGVCKNIPMLLCITSGCFVVQHGDVVRHPEAGGRGDGGADCVCGPQVAFAGSGAKLAVALINAYKQEERYSRHDVIRGYRSCVVNLLETVEISCLVYYGFT